MTFPWAVLGLEGPAGEAEIKRAYARRLKLVRPDGDAEAFQALVGARNLALQLSSVPTWKASRPTQMTKSHTLGCCRFLPVSKRRASQTSRPLAF